MEATREELNQAVVLFIGYGVNPFPRCDGEALIRAYGNPLGSDLSSTVIKLTNELNQIPFDWNQVNLVSAGGLVRAEMHSRHPELDDKALDALTWKFTYDWR